MYPSSNNSHTFSRLFRAQRSLPSAPGGGRRVGAHKRHLSTTTQHPAQVWIGGFGGVGSSIGACSGRGVLSGGGSFSGSGGGVSGSGVLCARNGRMLDRVVMGPP